MAIIWVENNIIKNQQFMSSTPGYDYFRGGNMQRVMVSFYDLLDAERDWLR